MEKCLVLASTQPFLHGSETWAPTAPYLQRLCRNEWAMILWICGVKPPDEVPMETLYTKLGIQEADMGQITLESNALNKHNLPKN